jgi:hypothetical protein
LPATVKATEMTDKLINVGIFWLPLIAGIILGGISPSVWYGGDKIAALWLAFVGVGLLLLTGAFQIQAYIQQTILQPQFELLKPEQKSILRWNPPTDNMMNIRGENDGALPPDQWRVPLFKIKNNTPINAQDVRLVWSAAKYDPTALIANKPIFQGRQIDITTDYVTMSGPTNSSRNLFKFSAEQEKPFITKSTEIWLPIEVWDTGALFFLATLPPEVGGRSEPYYFDLQITWNIPANTNPARYRIKAVATNATPPGGPAMIATIDFTVEKD